MFEHFTCPTRCLLFQYYKIVTLFRTSWTPAIVRVGFNVRLPDDTSPGDPIFMYYLRSSTSLDMISKFSIYYCVLGSYLFYTFDYLF